MKLGRFGQNFFAVAIFGFGFKHKSQNYTDWSIGRETVTYVYGII